MDIFQNIHWMLHYNKGGRAQYDQNPLKIQTEFFG